MTEQEIKDNAPMGETSYKYYEDLKMVAYYKEGYIKIDGFPSIKEQFLWYKDKWVYCTPLTGNIKPL